MDTARRDRFRVTSAMSSPARVEEIRGEPAPQEDDCLSGLADARPTYVVLGRGAPSRTARNLHVQIPTTDFLFPDYEKNEASSAVERGVDGLLAVTDPVSMSIVGPWLTSLIEGISNMRIRALGLSAVCWLPPDEVTRVLFVENAFPALAQLHLPYYTGVGTAILFSQRPNLRVIYLYGTPSQLDGVRSTLDGCDHVEVVYSER